ncbi:uncharacterized protein EDB91DRAFT_1284984 [Suillus paluster]|uniref:uncharacterized protein n=1 Tax=Suillus paluster TaxID=48578 RepID=UPI001B86CED9|nr:uncharacterized protein EDB91DRAFT_1284984 [Suillus paluster]KAG1739135.1 hypothetical protein EDB91DRAFT_1284984 [Suillus paluster]
MSAYGVISRAQRTSYLPATLWDNPRVDPDPGAQFFVTVHHIDRSAVERDQTGLFNYLHSIFANEVDGGQTYPQEDIRDPAAFGLYFFGGDVLVAIAGKGDPPAIESEQRGVREIQLSLDGARDGRMWEACVAGFYYVKPNYPGRSSHICNAGFIVPPSQRGSGYGRVLAKSYLHYAPALGYKASVFNLVYNNNAASIRLWETLNFTKAGLIPKAGRLRRKDGEGEEYVDAIVFYKSFEET